MLAPLHAPPPRRLCAASGLRSRRRPPSNPIGCAGVSCWGPGRREREMLLNKSCCRIHFYHHSLQQPPEKADIPSESRCLAPVVLLRLETQPPRGRSRSRNKVRRPSSNLAARALRRDAWQHRSVPKARMSANIPETHPDSF